MEVEVVFPQVCGAFYKAFLLEVDLSNSKAKVGFPKNWRPVSWTELGQIRCPDSGEGDRSLIPGCKVEALLPHHDNEYPGWWTGVLIKSKGELNVVEFQSGSEKYQDIVEQEKLRLPNNSPPLSKMDLLTKSFDVPPELQDYCSRTAVHENFRAKIRALCVMLSETSLTVLTCDDACLERADLLIDMHLKDLNTQKSLLARNDMVSHKNTSMVRERRSEGGASLVEVIRFLVPHDLVGLAIGREGSNVNEARRIPGIISIEYNDDDSMFEIKGETKEAVSKARGQLEYSKDTMLIPRGLAGKVIGRGGNVITDILEKSQVNNVKVVGDEESRRRDIDTGESVAFDFIGRRRCIDNAKLMMEYHVDHLKDVESILATRREMGPDEDTPTYYPRPNEERRRGGRGGRGRRGRGGHRTFTDTVVDGEDESPGSDSGASVEGVDTDDDNRKSSPDEEEPPPDRRRTRGPPRGGGGRGRGRGGYRRSRQGRGGARGGGRPSGPQSEPQEAVKEESNDAESPKPQRQTRGGGRGRGHRHQQQQEVATEAPPPSEDKTPTQEPGDTSPPPTES